MRIVEACLLLALSLVAVASAQNPVDQVIAEALKPSPLEKNLQQLTDQIGGRVPGTLAMRQAVDLESLLSKLLERTACTQKISLFPLHGPKVLPE